MGGLPDNCIYNQLNFLEKVLILNPLCFQKIAGK